MGVNKPHKTHRTRRFERAAYAPCVECGKMGKPTLGAIAAPSKPEQANDIFYLCECGARVGSHRRTGLPLGYPAGPETRAARAKAHKVFDRLWLHKVFPSRDAAYRWLIGATGIDPMRCHIGKLNQAEAIRVTQISLEYWHDHATEEQKAAHAANSAQKRQDAQAFNRAQAEKNKKRHVLGEAAHGSGGDHGLPRMWTTSHGASRDRVR